MRDLHAWRVLLEGPILCRLSSRESYLRSSYRLIDKTSFLLARAGRNLTTAIHKFAPLAIALVGIATTAWAGPIVTVPLGLTPGTQYRIAVITANLYDANSSDISFYNNEVNNEMNNLSGNTGSLLAGLGATWTAIVSTAGTSQGNDYGYDSAIVNVGEHPGVAIYNVQGLKVANDATTGGLFSNRLITPITSVFPLDYLNAHDLYAWTGTWRDGRPCGAVENFGCGSGTVLGRVPDPIFFEVGAMAGNLPSPYSGTYNVGWLTAGWLNPPQFTNSYGLHLYAISSDLTVPDAPEPATEGLLLAGLVLMGLAVRRRKTAQRWNYSQTGRSNATPHPPIPPLNL